MQGKSRKRDLSKLVYVERQIISHGREVPHRMWIAGDRVRPDDLVIAGEDNVRPYRYAAEQEDRPVYKPPRGNNTGSVRRRRETAVFGELIDIQSRI